MIEACRECSGAYLSGADPINHSSLHRFIYILAVHLPYTEHARGVFSLCYHIGSCSPGVMSSCHLVAISVCYRGFFFCFFSPPSSTLFRLSSLHTAHTLCSQMTVWLCLASGLRWCSWSFHCLRMWPFNNPSFTFLSCSLVHRASRGLFLWHTDDGHCCYGFSVITEMRVPIVECGN